MSEKTVLPDGIYLNGIVDAKYSPEPKQGQQRKYKVLVNMAGYREKQEVTLSFADYEKLQIGESFKCLCTFGIFNNRIYWQPLQR